MKKIYTVILCSVFMLLIPNAVYAAKIITAPIDGRPISSDYLKNLVELGGDDFLCSDKANLDFFSAIEDDNFTGNSEKVRQELFSMVAESNNTDTSVIINSSSYFTNGLVGSRCGVNYTDIDAALDDLYLLLTTCSEPTYYINLSMPRTLPETRFNEVWSDNELRYGLGFYYLKYNSNCEDREVIYSKYRRVTPIQLIMEYSYVVNKTNELGEDMLEEWEKDFLREFELNYKNYYPYKTYISNYIKPFKAVSDMFRTFMTWQNEGLIDEIIISNDDFQLPDFIVYINSKDSGDASKYSFARRFMSTGVSAIIKQLKAERGKKSVEMALKGKGENVNFIFGTDELPQLIYARDFSKRTGLSANFNIIAENGSGVAAYDVLSANELIENALNFVSAGNKKMSCFDLMLYDYGVQGINNVDKAFSSLAASYAAGNMTGLIEIYSNETLNTGDNRLFQKLTDNTGFGITDLNCYSAWNTNANAIGLGVAHAQVYAVASENAGGREADLLEKQLKVLMQHIIEDGIYTVRVKRELSNRKYIPNAEERTQSDMLYEMLRCDSILDSFVNKAYSVDNADLCVKSADIVRCSFPWGRTFDCYIEPQIKVNTIKS